MSKYLFSLFLFLSLSSPGQQSFVVSGNCQSAYNSVLSLRFEEAKGLIKKDQLSNPGNLYAVYLENYIDFLSIFISEDKKLFDFYSERKQKRIDNLKKINEKSPYKNYLVGNVYLQSALIEIKFGEYLTAALDFNRAYRLIEENSEAFPEFLPNKISMSMLSIMVGLVPENYRWFLGLLSMEGSVSEGRNTLLLIYKASLTDPEAAFLRKETLFYLGFVDLNINPEKENIMQLLDALRQTENQGLLLNYLAVNMLMKTGQNEAALLKFQEIEELEMYYPFSYLDYLQAECYLRKLDFRDANFYYNKFKKEFKGKNYLKDAVRKQAWIALLEGDTLNYLLIMKQVSKNGNMDVDIDREAEKESELNEIPEINLLKTRLLYDGGYYSEAKKLLTSLNLNNLTQAQKVEFSYRFARINHDSGNLKEAKIYYDKTILSGKGLKKYYAGNSALKLGEIYESERNYQRAKEYYSICLKLDFDEYEASIHGKAKAGLERVSK